VAAVHTCIIVRLMKPKLLQWDEHVFHIEDTRNTHGIFVGVVLWKAVP
jgi:hypothetical protein